MTKLKEVLALVREINADEFHEQYTNGDSLDDVYKELLFLAEKMASKKKRTNEIIEHISNCFAGDFFNYLPISDAQDELDVFCMGFNTYIEELKAVMVSKNLLITINKKLVDEKERSDELSLVKEEFTSSMSHEIRTPLNAVLGFTAIMLKNDSLDSESRKYLEYIKMSGDLLLVIVNDILDFAKIEAGEIDIMKKTFGIKSLVQMIQNTFLVKIQEKEIEFKISIDEDVPAILIGDSVRVSQIIFNLMNNAVKFTPINGQIKLNIKFDEEEEDFYLIKIVVEDSGIGIPEDKTNVIFNPFVQLNNEFSVKNTGTGLGLTITKKIVTIMGGEIQVKSTLNVGTEFAVILPFTKNDHFLSSSESFIKNQNPIRTIKKDRKINVLIVEDNHLNQILLQKALSDFNFEFSTVGNGELAVDAVVKGNFDVVLMDILMPIMDGYEATIAIRNLEDNIKKKIPIIALSAVVTGPVVEACELAGMNKYMSKPFDSGNLYHAIVQLVDNVTKVKTLN